MKFQSWYNSPCGECTHSRPFFTPCCVFQAVAHSLLRAWWGSVCVWRVCQQPIVSTQSCKTHKSYVNGALLLRRNWKIWYSNWLPFFLFIYQAHSNELLVFNVQPKSLVRWVMMRWCTILWTYFNQFLKNDFVLLFAYSHTLQVLHGGSSAAQGAFV